MKTAFINREIELLSAGHTPKMDDDRIDWCANYGFDPQSAEILR